MILGVKHNGQAASIFNKFKKLSNWTDTVNLEFWFPEFGVRRIQKNLITTTPWLNNAKTEASSGGTELDKELSTERNSWVSW